MTNISKELICRFNNAVIRNDQKVAPKSFIELYKSIRNKGLQKKAFKDLVSIIEKKYFEEKVNLSNETIDNDVEQFLNTNKEFARILFNLDDSKKNRIINKLEQSIPYLETQIGKNFEEMFHDCSLIEDALLFINNSSKSVDKVYLIIEELVIAESINNDQSGYFLKNLKLKSGVNIKLSDQIGTFEKFFHSLGKNISLDSIDYYPETDEEIMCSIIKKSALPLEMKNRFLSLKSPDNLNLSEENKSSKKHVRFDSQAYDDLEKISASQESSKMEKILKSIKRAHIDSVQITGGLGILGYRR